MEKRADFTYQLKRFRRSWQAGLLLANFLRLIMVVVIAVGLYACCDCLLAFESDARFALNLILPAVIAIWQIICLARILCLSDKDVAAIADDSLKSRRRIVLTALELQKYGPIAPDAEKPAGMNAYLIDRCVQMAARRMGGTAIRERLPVVLIQRRFKLTLGILLMGIFIRLVFADAGHIVWQRLLHPFADIPPYSRYVFEIKPQQPKVVYGRTLALTVDITGKPVRDKVWLLTRRDKDIVRTPCFQATARKFSQRLENIVYPVSFCFAVGRARSKWQQVNLLLHPKIDRVQVEITPPAYSGKPKRQFVMEDNTLEDLSGTSIILTVDSNRPLSEGLLTLASSNGAKRLITAEIKRSRSAVFNWTLNESASLDLSLFDELGTRNKAPYRIQQRLVPDKPPDISISEPSLTAAATPYTTLPFNARIEDDIGIKRVDLIRTVVGYRDRVKHMGPEDVRQRVDIAKTMAFKTLGVEPGQTLEFYLEAIDNNPSLLGISTSDIVRIKIITNDEYASMLRAREQIDAFTRRYRLLHDALQAVYRQAQAIQNMLKASSGPPLTLAAELKKLAALNDQAHDTFKLLAEDFHIYDIEKQTAPQLFEIAEALAKNRATMAQLPPDSLELSGVMDQLIKDLAKFMQKASKNLQDAREIAKIAKIMACSVRFKQLYESQAHIVRRLQRNNEPNFGAGLIKVLGDRQGLVKNELVELVRDMRALAEALPQGKMYQGLRESTQKFAQQVEDLGIDALMAAAVGAAGQHNAYLMSEKAYQALAMMERLLSETGNSDFGKFGRQQCFSVAENLQSTMQQFLDGLWMGGAGQGGSSGYSLGEAYSPLNLPVYGPARTQFGQAQSGKTVEAAARSGKAMDVDEKLPVSEAVRIEQRNVWIENAPEKYRKALKIYFSRERQ